MSHRGRGRGWYYKQKYGGGSGGRGWGAPHDRYEGAASQLSVPITYLYTSIHLGLIAQCGRVVAAAEPPGWAPPFDPPPQAASAAGAWSAQADDADEGPSCSALRGSHVDMGALLQRIDGAG